MSKNEKTVLITGGNKGIGLELTKAFLELEYRIIVVARTGSTTTSKSASSIFWKHSLSQEKQSIFLDDDSMK